VSASHCLEATVSRAGGSFGITASGLLSLAAATGRLSSAAAATGPLSGAGAGMVIVFIIGNRRGSNGVAAVRHGLRIVAVLHEAIFDEVLVVPPAHKK
jgi:hypothetical protein